MAKKILFDSNKRATGVQVAAAGLLPFVLSASKEVIISAGAFQSPQLLMVSGIGPADQLQPLGIPIVHENTNVGQNSGCSFQVERSIMADCDRSVGSCLRRSKLPDGHGDFHQTCMQKVFSACPEDSPNFLGKTHADLEHPAHRPMIQFFSPRRVSSTSPNRPDRSRIQSRTFWVGKRSQIHLMPSYRPGQRTLSLNSQTTGKLCGTPDCWFSLTRK